MSGDEGDALMQNQYRLEANTPREAPGDST